MADIFEGLPRNHFECIVADPPWQFKSRTALTKDNWDTRRDIEKHYGTMTIAEIRAMPVRELAAKNAHFWLWTTGPFLPQAFGVIEDFGFRYSGSGLVWIKLKKTHGRRLRLLSSTEMERELHCGLGHTTRKNAEFCLLARRGSPKRLARDIREVILAPLREHSRKPDEAYSRIERYCSGPRLELFARESREGWTTWGNEREKFDDILKGAA
jgi:N6-adenosine-specific RNA methylase IME4